MKAAILVVPAGAALLLLTVATKEAMGGHFAVLREGTPVVVTLTEEFDAAAFEEGEKLPMVVAEEVAHDGFVLIGAGAPVEATFVPGKSGDAGAVLLRISSLRAADGQDVMLRTAPEALKADGDDDAAGQVMRIVPGEDRRTAKDRTLTLYLSDTYYIEE